VNYSSPRMRGRKVFGELVPYGEVWSTGDNDATTLVSDEDSFTVKGKIPAGSYTIFTVPNPDQWTLIINKHTGELGIPYKYESEELARVPMSVTKLSSPVEDFTISFDRTSGSCIMHMSWENTEASAEFSLGMYHRGEGASNPGIISQVDPEYSAEARKAKFEGICVLTLVVEPDGTPSHIRVSRSLGMGLDEKAIEAAKKWRFRPSMKDGHPVRYGPVEVDMSFRLYNR
jgi:TonB family protein